MCRAQLLNLSCSFGFKGFALLSQNIFAHCTVPLAYNTTLEVPDGFEPPSKVLQTSAYPLGYGTNSNFCKDTKKNNIFSQKNKKGLNFIFYC